MPFKKVTAEEWVAMGLPIEISTIEFNNNFFNKEKNFDKISIMENFICPECGSNNEGNRLLLSKEISGNDNKDPWSSVLEQISCGDCGSVIPAHLAERWDNLSVDAAKKEWLQVYKKDNKKQKIL